MTINLFSLAVAGVLLWWISADIMLDRNRRKYFQLCIILTMVVIVAELGCALTDNTTAELRWLSILFNTIGFGVSPFIFLVESNCYKSEKKEDRLVRLLYLAPAFISLGFVLLSPMKGYIFYVADDCTYTHGEFYFVYLAAFVFSIAWSCLKKLQVAKNVPDYFRRRIISSEVILGGGLLLQVAFPELKTTWIIVTICLTFFYALSCQMDSILDGLTGLLNRAAFNKVLDHNFGEGRGGGQNNSCMMLMMLDVNDFKRVNDRHGHRYGDYCLQEIANILRKAAPKGAQVFRYGGDEFTAIFPSKPSASVVSAKAALSSMIQEKRKVEPDFPEVATGFAEFEQGRTIAQVMNLADSRMYEEKLRMKAAERAKRHGLK